MDLLLFSQHFSWSFHTTVPTANDAFLPNRYIHISTSASSVTRSSSTTALKTPFKLAILYNKSIVDAYPSFLFGANNLVDTVLSRPAFHCTQTQLFGSVHMGRAQPKVGPTCLSKLTVASCATGFKLFLGGIKSVAMFPFCTFMLQTTPIWLDHLCQASCDTSVVFLVPGWGAW